MKQESKAFLKRMHKKVITSLVGRETKLLADQLDVYVPTKTATIASGLVWGLAAYGVSALVKNFFGSEE